jgi:PAS domain S-box-containing protein
MTSEITPYFEETALKSITRIFLPVYKNGLPHNTPEEKRKNLVGFIPMLLDIQAMTQVTLKGLMPSGVDIYIYDDARPSGEKLIYFRPCKARQPLPTQPLFTETQLQKREGLYWDKTFAVADHTWTVICRPAPFFFATYHMRVSWVSLFLGILLSALLALYLLGLSRRTEEIEILVRERTAQLQENEIRYRTLFESSRDAVMTLVPEGKFLSGNRATLELFKCASEAEFISKKPANLSPEYQPDGQTSLAKSLQMMRLAMEKGSHFFEWVHRRTDGSEFFATVLLSRMEIKGQKLLQATVRDITEHRRLEHIKDEFVGMVSHELRTPLSIIKEGVSLIKDEIPGKINPKQSHILGTSLNNIDRLTRIIDSLLDVSKIEAGKIELQPRMLNLSALIREVADNFAPKLKEKKLNLKLNLPKEDIEVFGDNDRLVQVLTNLLSNAVKFMDKGQIDISLVDKKEEVECSIADSGVGISQDDMPRLFEKFSQFGRLIGPGEKGTGLGLSIAKGIIDLHKGKIWAQSEPGKGTKFTFTLPKAAR